MVAAVATTVIYSSNQEQERQQLEAQLAEEQNEAAEQVAATEEKAETAEASSVILPEETDGTQTAQSDASAAEASEEAETESTETAEIEGAGNAEETAETGTQVSALHFSPEDGMVWPMEGDVILNYSMDATVYFETLDQYKYNPAVIIKGDVNDKVYSAAKGQVTDISNNEVTGCTMTVDLGDGYQAIYGQLKELNFKVGDYVESGHVLGYVAEPTKYFSLEGSNLYFALEKDGEPVDPAEFFES